MSMKAKRNLIRVIHKAPGKKGKQEYREFDTFEEAWAYIERNEGRCHMAKGRFDAASFKYPARSK